MFRLLVIAALSGALFISSAWAQETDPAGELTDQWAAEQAARAVRQERLDGLMVTMASEMADIRATTNRAERESLMVAHRENMREAMGLMRSMGGAHLRKAMSQHVRPGTKEEMGSSMSEHAHKGMDSSQPLIEMTSEQRLSDLENRMDMMHVMMESMMEVDAKH